MKRSSGVKAEVKAGVKQRETYSEGGVFPFSRWVCFPPHFSMLLFFRCFAVITRPDRAAPEVRGGTGATPPFLPLVRHAGRRGVPGGVPMGVPPPPPLLGSLPSDLSLREGSEHTPHAGADAPEVSPMKPRYSFLIIGGLGCSAWGFIYRPFPLPGEDSVLYHIPNFYGWIVH